MDLKWLNNLPRNINQGTRMTEDEKLIDCINFLSERTDLLKDRILNSDKISFAGLDKSLLAVELTSILDLMKITNTIEEVEEEHDLESELFNLEASTFDTIAFRREKLNILRKRKNETDFQYLTDRVLTNGEISIYENPSVDGVKYEVPVISKNRDVLIGLVEGINFVTNLISQNIDPIIGLVVKRWIADIQPLSSSTLSNVSGNGNKTSKEELTSNTEHLKYLMDDYGEELDRVVEEDIDSKDIINLDGKTTKSGHTMDYREVPEFEITCTGCMHHEKLDSKDLPSSNLNCPSCGNILIEYTSDNYKNFHYNDDSVKIAKRE